VAAHTVDFVILAHYALIQIKGVMDRRADVGLDNG